MTTIGIIGAGALGSNFARVLAKSGQKAMISNSRGPASLASLVGELGPNITAVTTEEAAKADVVVIALRWVDIPKVLGGLPEWNGRIVVDGTNPVAWIDPNSPDAKDPSNPLAKYGIKAVDLGGRHSSDVVRQLVPGARVVKALNHFDVRLLLEPQVNGGRRALFVSGDDDSAKAVVRGILETAGFFSVDLGALDVGGPLSSPPFGALAGVPLVKTETHLDNRLPHVEHLQT